MEKVGLQPSHHKTNTYMNPHTTLTMLEYYGHSGLITSGLITGRSQVPASAGSPVSDHSSTGLTPEWSDTALAGTCDLPVINPLVLNAHALLGISVNLKKRKIAELLL